MPYRGKRASRSMEMALSCSICSEIFHRPANVMPCGHNFCAACIMWWIATVPYPPCPQCRVLIRGVSLDYTLIAILDAFLEENPYLERTLNDVQQYDSTERKALKRIKRQKTGVDLSYFVELPVQASFSSRLRRIACSLVQAKRWAALNLGSLVCTAVPAMGGFATMVIGRALASVSNSLASACNSNSAPSTRASVLARPAVTERVAIENAPNNPSVLGMVVILAVGALSLAVIASWGNA